MLIEKHFTLDRKLPGVDQSISMEPQELKQLKTDLVDVAKIMGDDKKQIQPSEIVVKKSARRSLVANLNISAGTVLTSEMVSFRTG